MSNPEGQSARKHLLPETRQMLNITKKRDVDLILHIKGCA